MLKPLIKNGPNNKKLPISHILQMSTIISEITSGPNKSLILTSSKPLCNNILNTIIFLGPNYITINWNIFIKSLLGMIFSRTRKRKSKKRSHSNPKNLNKFKQKHNNQQLSDKQNKRKNKKLFVLQTQLSILINF